MPTNVGMTWEYSADEQPRTDQPRGVVIQIVGTEQLAGKAVLKVETRVAGAGSKTELMSVDEKGLHCHQKTSADGAITSFDPPQTLAAPLKTGATWDADGVVAGTQLRHSFTAQAEEVVTVPAGTYQAFRFHAEQPWPMSVVADRWFAPGVGVVKDVITTRGPNGRLLSRVTTVLTKLSQAPLPSQAPAASLPGDEAVGPAAGPRIQLETAAEREGDARAEFRSDAPNIFVRWAGAGLSVDSTVRVAWVAEDVGDVAPANFIVDETETKVTQQEFGARFTLSRPRDGWAAGKYRVDLYLDDELMQSFKVTIND